MTNTNTTRRMTLRQLITYTDKCARDLHEQIYATLLPQLSEFRDLSRPVRRRSHYPTLLAIQNSMRKLFQANEEITSLIKHLEEHLDEVRLHAKQELVNRA